LKILSIGEVLWDVIGGKEFLGGAPFNFAAHAARLGHESYLLTAVGDDERGRRVFQEASRLGVQTRYMEKTGQGETGLATVTAGPDGNPVFSIVRPAAYDFLAPSDDLLTDNFDVIYYGTLVQTFEPACRATTRVLTAFPNAHHFYDVNLRPGHFDLSLVETLMRHATLLKLNEAETAIITGTKNPSEPEFCETQSRLFGLEAIAITRGPKGSAVWVRGEYTEAPAFPVAVADTVGAGDAFAAAFLHGVVAGWPAPRVAEFANRAGAFVASRTGAVPEWNPQDLQELRSAQG